MYDSNGIEIGETIPVREYPEDEEGPFNLGELPRSYRRVDEAIEKVANSGEDLCIAVRNVGATPWFRPTPYENERGVVVQMWSCISVYPKAVPGDTMLFGRRNPIWPDESDDYNVKIFTKEWVRSQLMKASHFEIHPVSDSPFCTDWYTWRPEK